MLTCKRFLLLAVIVSGAMVAGVSPLTPWNPSPAWAEDPVVDQGVRATIAQKGHARVIVELRLPWGHRAEGELPNPGAVATQRADIASSRAQLVSRLAGTRHRVAHAYRTVPFLALDVGADALAQLEASGQIVGRVMPDTLRPPVLGQSVPLVDGPAAWAGGYDGSGTAVAILDTGVERTHPFLANKVVAEACFSTSYPLFGSSTVCPGGQEQAHGAGSAVPCPLSVDGCWHGTHVAGIAAGNGPPAGQAFSGVAKGARIVAVQVFSRIDDASQCQGPAPCVEAWDSDVIAGLEEVYSLHTQLNIAAVNLSLGSRLFLKPCDNEPHKPMIDNLRSVGIATVIASGNDSSTNRINSPACISSAVSVGATSKAAVLAPYSNVNRFLWLLAPGTSILSSYPGGLYATATGTSMAAPHVTGAFAILRQASPTATVGTLLASLERTGTPVADTRPGGDVTTPLIQIAEALQAFVTNAGPPALSSLDPATATAGGPSFTLLVRGSGFTAGSVVRWKGSPRPTTFVESGRLTAVIGEGDIAATGTASVTVFTAPPGGGQSNALPFVIAATAGPGPNQTLTVKKAGAGAGRVTSAPAGIDCGPSCSKNYAAGTVVTLASAPDPRSAFAGWTGACTGKSACVVTMSTARSVTAIFRHGR